MGTIAILGCGWLGLPLAKRLISKGYNVKGSTTKQERISVLKKEGIEPFIISCLPKADIQNLEKFLSNVQILIIDTPPLSKNKKEVPQYYEPILEVAMRKKVSKLLLTSSTAVFEQTSDFPICTEKTQINPTQPRSENLYAIEQYVSQHKEIKTTIVRLGGLYGENRHPAYYLSGKTNVENPYTPINLTSQDLAVRGIISIIKNNDFGKIFHLVEKEHPARIFYYTQKCLEKNMIPPHFLEEGSSEGKFVSSCYINNQDLSSKTD